MRRTFLAPRARSRHAVIGAVALFCAGFGTLLLSHVDVPLTPMRTLALALAAFAAWSFCDEMGLRKPLNRAGFVFFAIAAMAKLQLLLGVTPSLAGRYALTYAACLLIALLLWSVAFMHRQPVLKMVGTVGAVASLGPIVALVVGHLAVGAGAALGVESILSAAPEAGTSTPGFLVFVERLFGLWAYVAAWALWRGHVDTPTAIEAPAA